MKDITRLRKQANRICEYFDFELQTKDNILYVKHNGKKFFVSKDQPFIVRARGEKTRLKYFVNVFKFVFNMRNPDSPITDSEYKFPKLVETDSGRAEAGYGNATGDCVVTAMTALLKWPYKKTAEVLNADWSDWYYNRYHEPLPLRGRKACVTHYGVIDPISTKRMVENGWKRIRFPQPTSLSEAVAKYPTSLMQSRRHCWAAIDGKVYDSYDSRFYQKSMRSTFIEVQNRETGEFEREYIFGAGLGQYERDVSWVFVKA